MRRPLVVGTAPWLVPAPAKLLERAPVGDKWRFDGAEENGESARRAAREPGFAVIAVQHVDEMPPPPPAMVISGLFGFTPTETEVALALLRGDEVSSIAAARGTSIETVRGHVKSLLRKSGMSSQKQLTATLSRIATLAAQQQR